MTAKQLMRKHNLNEWDMSTIGQSRNANGQITQMIWMNPNRKYIVTGTYFDDEEWALMMKYYKLKVIDYDIESETLLMRRQT